MKYLGKKRWIKTQNKYNLTIKKKQKTDKQKTKQQQQQQQQQTSISSKRNINTKAMTSCRHQKSYA